jgi:hypothetical protein
MSIHNRPFSSISAANQALEHEASSASLSEANDDTLAVANILMTLQAGSQVVKHVTLSSTTTNPFCELAKEGDGIKHSSSTRKCNDPLKRQITVTQEDGSTAERVAKICYMCYMRAKQALLINQGTKCDFETDSTHPHKININGLLPHPNKQTIPIKLENGSIEERVAKICYTCYMRAKQALLINQGTKCDFETDSTHPHTIDTKGLFLHPNKQTITVKLDNGSLEERVAKICQSCFRMAKKELLIKQGSKCDFETDPTHPHKIDTNGLRPHPNNQTITVKRDDGSLEERVAKICQSCFKKAKQDLLIKQGSKCDFEIDPTHPHKIDINGLSLHPNKQTITVKLENGSIEERVAKICQSCFRMAKQDNLLKQGSKCDFEKDSAKPHRITTSGLISHPDPDYPEITITKEDGTQEQRKAQLCSNCYHKALKTVKQSQQQEGASSEDKDTSPTTTITTAPSKRKEPQLTAASSSTSQEESEASDIEDSFSSKRPRKASQVVIKCEPDEELYLEEDIAIINVQQRKNRTVNNQLPILQDPENPSLSLLEEVEGPLEEIQRVSWGSLAGIPLSDKKEILSQMQQWLYLNEYERERYSARLDEELKTMIPVGFGPERGLSVFASKDFKKYDVIGPYAGVLHRTEESLASAMKKAGRVPTLTYLFSTRSSKRSIDAFKTGNTLSLINTGRLHDESPSWQENNLASVVLGKNLIFIIAVKEIKEGTELLLDYGPSYNPYQGFKEE